MIFGNSKRRRPGSRQNKLETIKLEESTNKMMEKLKEMKIFVENQKKKEKNRKNKPTTIRKIRGFSENLIQAQQSQIMKGIKPKGIKAYDEAIKKRISKVRSQKQSKKGNRLDLWLEKNQLIMIKEDILEAGVTTLEELIKFDEERFQLKPGHEIRLSRALKPLRLIIERKKTLRKRQSNKILSSGKKEGLQIIRDPNNTKSRAGRLQSILNKTKNSTNRKQLVQQDSFDGILHRPIKQMGLKRPQQQQQQQIQKSLSKKKTPSSSITPKTFENSSCGTQNQTKISSTSCWVCFKNLEDGKECIHPILDNKFFCSKECLREEFKSVSSSCQICNKILMKIEGIPLGSQWFCSDECLEQSEDYKIYLELEEQHFEDLETPQNKMQEEKYTPIPLQDEDVVDAELGFTLPEDIDLDFKIQVKLTSDWNY